MYFDPVSILVQIRVVVSRICMYIGLKRWAILDRYECHSLNMWKLISFILQNLKRITYNMYPVMYNVTHTSKSEQNSKLDQPFEKNKLQSTALFIKLVCGGRWCLLNVKQSSIYAVVHTRLLYSRSIGNIEFYLNFNFIRFD